MLHLGRLANAYVFILLTENFKYMSIKFFKGNCRACARKCSSIPVLCADHEAAVSLERLHFGTLVSVRKVHTVIKTFANNISSWLYPVRCAYIRTWHMKQVYTVRSAASEGSPNPVWPPKLRQDSHLSYSYHNLENERESLTFTIRSHQIY